MRYAFWPSLTATLCLATVMFSQTTPEAKLSHPIYFEPNVGQTDPQVQFVARSHQSAIYFTSEGVVFALYSEHDRQPFVSALRLSWIGANRAPKIAAEKPLEGRVNYLIGKDPSHWHTNLPTYARVRYRNLYPGIDAVFYGNEGEAEYDLEVAPGASVDSIKFAFAGAKAVRLAENGDLVISSDDGDMRQHVPKVFQNSRNGRKLLDTRYVLHPDKTISYQVSGVDPARELIIDPTLSYSTYIGSNTADTVNSVAVDQYGHVYATGTTLSGFPRVGGISGNRLGTDAFVTKFSATGGSLIYSTYLGGDGPDSGIAIAVDSGGNAYITGDTRGGTGFPTKPGFAYASDYPAPVFLTKLGPSGSTIVYSFTFAGGDSDYAFAIALDNLHRVYITGFTCDGSSFPTVNAYQSVSRAQNCADGGGDAFLVRVNAAGTDFDYSTLLGGDIATLASGVAVDSNYSAYVTGWTESTDFPTTPGAYQRTLIDNSAFPTNPFVTKFAPDGRSLSYSTFFRGALVHAIAVDSTGHAYITGSAGSELPTTAGAYQRTAKGSGDAFVTKFWATGGGLFYSTFVGGSGQDSANSIAVDSTGAAYITGSTTSANFPLKSPLQGTFGGATDAFVTKISANGGSLVYSTYLGGLFVDIGNSIRLDGNQNAYVGGQTASPNFPTTAGAYSRTYKGGGADGWVAKIKP